MSRQSMLTAAKDHIVTPDGKILIVQMDARELVTHTLTPKPMMHCDLVFGSPPYLDQRSYEGIELPSRLDHWTNFMIDLTIGFLKCSPTVCWVVGSKVKDHQYVPAAEMLITKLYKSFPTDQLTLARSHIYWRNGTPGSGGDTEFRCDHEYVVIAKRGPGPLAYCDTQAIGHAPVYAPGGRMTNRGYNDKRASRKAYDAPKLSNPGTVTGPCYRLQDVLKIMEECDGTGTVSYHVVGGGHMGSHYAHQNEAPMPLSLAERYVKSLCPPDGVVIDPFGGSGTTAHACAIHGRHCVTADVRKSQFDLMRQRLSDYYKTTWPGRKENPAAGEG